jgi:N-acetylglutamate synthase-like GNAT family acetyltransferase
MEVVNIREQSQYKKIAIEYFQEVWGTDGSSPIHKDCIERSFVTESPLPIWYLLINGDDIIGCAGLITNDFISCMDLWPWLCAMYIEEELRGNAYGKLLIDQIKADTAKVGFDKVYLCTDHIGYYEKYGFQYVCEGYHPWGESSRVYECAVKHFQ